MKAELYIEDIPASTTLDELNTLFEQAGEIIESEIVKDCLSGLPKGFAFITMSAPSEADKAISIFNSYLFHDHVLTVTLAKPREQSSI